MLRPHGADFLGASQFAALNLGFGFGKIGFFLCRQLDRRLINAGELNRSRASSSCSDSGQAGNFAKGFFETSSGS